MRLAGSRAVSTRAVRHAVLVIRVTLPPKLTLSITLGVISVELNVAGAVAIGDVKVPVSPKAGMWGRRNQQRLGRLFFCAALSSLTVSVYWVTGVCPV